MEFGIDPISFEATLRAPFLVKSIGFYELIDLILFITVGTGIFDLEIGGILIGHFAFHLKNRSGLNHQFTRYYFTKYLG